MKHGRCRDTKVKVRGWHLDVPKWSSGKKRIVDSREGGGWMRKERIEWRMTELEEAFMGGEMLLMGAVSAIQLHVLVFYCPVGRLANNNMHCVFKELKKKKNLK